MPESKKALVRNSLVPWLISVGVITAVSLTICGYFWLFTSSSSKAADLGQFGDYFAGMLNPFFGLLTTIFAFLAYRNTQEQLFIQKLESKTNKFNDLNKQFDIDLDKVVQSYIYKQRAHDVEFHGTEEVFVENLHKEKIYTGIEASKKYRDFLLDQRKLLTQESRDEPFRRVTSKAIYHEIYRVKILIDAYERRISEDFKEQYLERVRMTLPFSIISCFVLLQSFEAILNKNNTISEWLELTNLKKYYVKNEIQM